MELTLESSKQVAARRTQARHCLAAGALLAIALVVGCSDQPTEVRAEGVTSESAPSPIADPAPVAPPEGVGISVADEDREHILTGRITEGLVAPTEAGALVTTFPLSSDPLDPVRVPDAGANVATGVTIQVGERGESPGLVAVEKKYIEDRGDDLVYVVEFVAQGEEGRLAQLGVEYLTVWEEEEL